MRATNNAVSGAMVTGGRLFRPFDFDAVLGHPAAGVAWLVNKLHAVGEKLQWGQIVLCGSFTRPVFVRRCIELGSLFGVLARETEKLARQARIV